MLSNDAIFGPEEGLIGWFSCKLQHVLICRCMLTFISDLQFRVRSRLHFYARVPRVWSDLILIWYASYSLRVIIFIHAFGFACRAATDPLWTWEWMRSKTFKCTRLWPWTMGFWRCPVDRILQIWGSIHPLRPLVVLQKPWEPTSHRPLRNYMFALKHMSLTLRERNFNPASKHLNY